ERTPDLNDRTNEGAFLSRTQYRHDQLPVDLQPLRSELQKADDRCVPRAEIIDLDFDAECLDFIEVAGNLIFMFVKKDGLDQLKRYPSRLDIKRFEGCRQVFIVQTPQRHVDGHFG